MSTIINSMPNMAGFIMPATLGGRMSIALQIAEARNLPEISKALKIGQEFAAQHDFYLPEPRGQLQERLDQYREITVPWFAYRVRDVFNGQLREIARSERIIDRFHEEELSTDYLLSAAKFSLVSYNSAMELLRGMELEFLDLSERAGTLETPKNPYFKLSSFGRRAALDATAVMSAWMLFAGHNAALISAVVFASGFELTSLILGRREKLMRMKECREIRSAFESRAPFFKSVRGAIADFEANRYKIPFRAFPPQAEAQELRKAVIRENLGTMDGYVVMLDSVKTLRSIVGEPLRYIVVQLPEGQGEEIRLASINFSHQQMFIAGERLVGAGTMVYIQPKGRCDKILLDGKSESFPTTENSVLNTISTMLAEKPGISSVKESFENILGRKIKLVDVDEVVGYN